MLDKNGVEICTGQVVKVTGAFFKNDNGLYLSLIHISGTLALDSRSSGYDKLEGISEEIETWWFYHR